MFAPKAHGDLFAGRKLKGYMANDLRVEFDDKALAEGMRRAVKGDAIAYRDVLVQTTRILRPYLARRISAADQVEDILQEILLSIHKARHTYDGQRLYLPWAFAIAKFRLNDHLRKHYGDQLRRAEELSHADHVAHASPEETEQAGDFEAAMNEVERLPAKQAQILRLVHREGYTLKEAAQKIGMNESAVKVSAHRAYKSLRKRLAE